MLPRYYTSLFLQKPKKRQRRQDATNTPIIPYRVSQNMSKQKWSKIPAPIPRISIKVEMRALRWTIPSFYLGGGLRLCFERLRELLDMCQLGSTPNCSYQPISDVIIPLLSPSYYLSLFLGSALWYQGPQGFYLCMILVQKRNIYNVIIKMQEESRPFISQYNPGKTSFHRHKTVQSILFKEVISSLQIYDDSLYVGTAESRVLVYDIAFTEKTQKPVEIKYKTKIYPHCTEVYLIVAVEQFIVIVPYQEQQLIRIWNRNSLSLMHGYKGHSKQISQVIFLKDGRHIVSSSHDATVRVWNVYEHSQFQKQLAKYQGEYPILGVQEIDQSILALAGDSCFITLWNWQKGQRKCKVFAHPGSVLSLNYYHPYLVSSGGDSKIKIWEIKQNIASSVLLQSQRQLQGDTQLMLVKQIKSRLSQSQFFLRLSGYQMLLVNSTGRGFLIDSKLEIRQFKIELEYWREIVSIRLWNNYLLYFGSCDKKEKKYLRVYAFHQEDVNEYAEGFQLEGEMQNQLVSSLFQMPVQSSMEMKQIPKK